jgi:hypothetical protein
MSEAPEPAVTINGHVLSIGEAMTLRVAVTGFHNEMMTQGLGDDEHGKRMAWAYARNCESMFRMMGLIPLDTSVDYTDWTPDPDAGSAELS